ncbi:TonB-dependent receptor [Helicobacter sp. 11S03491-1]|uniref:TonB-dependent receptor n=1 Tax=Helicobacter sp. 11S03491-1 TaxID=1476196 RepID=UPI000BA5E0A5|nr:TonB-dependent receptor [Helicobacter sp. 11S03491-1]PAF43296.1 hypothetical protein BKH45_01260 [Helicobacter sp. 11S03491-1]
MKKRKILALSVFLFQILYAANQTEATLNKVVTSATGFDMQLKDEPRNIYVIDKDQITNKGYQSLDEALKYVPLLSFSNNGFGGNIDLRGQGGEANMAVKVLVNRVPINLLDTSHGTTPINMINIEDIESIEVLPGGGAVVYGNGTRGGVINIVTKQNPKNFANLTLKGGSYQAKNTLFGRADISAGRNFGEKFFLKADASVANTNGYRRGDSLFNYYLGGQARYQITSNQSLNLNVNYSHSLSITSPALSFEEIKKDRRAQGKGKIKSLEDFVSTSIDYRIKTDSWDFDLLGFYEMNHTNYPTNISQAQSHGQTTPFDESGTSFFNQAAGLNFKGKWDKYKNTLLFGYDFLYQNTLRDSKSHYVVTTTAKKFPGMPLDTTTHKPTMIDLTSGILRDHFWTSNLNAQKLSNSFYILDRYKFFKWFELSGGARYENSLYSLGRNKFTRVNADSRMLFTVLADYTGPDGKNDPYFHLHESKNNYALELTPNFKYSDTGNVYAKYERGFITPSPNQLMDSNKKGLYYNGLKPEKYDTFELGWKDEFAYSYLSATLYYTLTQDEININQISHGLIWNYTNLNQTQRLGVELIGIQDIFNSLHLNESLSYLDASITKGINKNKKVPLAKDYKITLGIAYDILKTTRQLLSIFTNNSFFGPSVDNSYSKVDAYILTDLGFNYSFKGFKFNGGIRNIFNTLYYEYQLAKSQDQFITAGYIPAPGRSYYAELRYDF